MEGRQKSTLATEFFITNVIIAVLAILMNIQIIHIGLSDIFIVNNIDSLSGFFRFLVTPTDTREVVNRMFKCKTYLIKKY